MNNNVHNSAGELIKPDVCLITEVLASVQFGSSSFRAKKVFYWQRVCISEDTQTVTRTATNQKAEARHKLLSINVLKWNHTAVLVVSSHAIALPDKNQRARRQMWDAKAHFLLRPCKAQGWENTVMQIGTRARNHRAQRYGLGTSAALCPSFGNQSSFPTFPPALFICSFQGNQGRKVNAAAYDTVKS